MENEKERYNAGSASRRRDKIKIVSIAAVFFLCSAVIVATKYKTDILTYGKATGQTATDTDAQKNDETTGTQTTTEMTEQDSTEEITTEMTTAEKSEEPGSTEDTEAEEKPSASGGATRTYINIDDPDLSAKGDDWYDADLYTPGNVTDDAYFDTAALIGDSRTEGLSLYTGLSNLDTFASKGLNIEKVMTDAVISTEEGTVTVLEALKQKQYENIYISFGINELGWAYDDIFIEEYKTFIDAVREEQPDAVIYIENILPVSKALSDEDEIYNNPNIEKFNKLIKEMCQDYGDVIYLDVASSVAVDGVLPADASTDGRHCNKEYCEKWLDYIRKNVYIR